MVRALPKGVITPGWMPGPAFRDAWDGVVPWNRPAPFGTALLEVSGGFGGLLRLLAGGPFDPGAVFTWLQNLDLPEERRWLGRLAQDESLARAELDSASAWFRLSALSDGFTWPRLMAVTATGEEFDDWIRGARQRRERRADWSAGALVPADVVAAWLSAHRGSAEAVLVERGMVAADTCGFEGGDDPRLGAPDVVGEARDIDASCSSRNADLPFHEAPSLSTIPPDSFSGVPDLGPSLERLRSLGLRALQRSTCGHQASADRARSLAERLLYERLQRLQETRGLFRLNAGVGLSWPSGRSLEVDLVALRYRLAVEVDGPHHFMDAERWRRDRSKDIILQQGGYLVVRVLASDVLERLDAVESTVIQVLRSRDQRD